MIYLTGYLAIGVVVILVVFISAWLSDGLEWPKLDPEIEWADLDWWGKLKMSAVLPLLVIFVITAWPVALYAKAQDILASRKAKADKEADEEARKFSITKADLVRQMTVEEIEQQERVTDPMDAVPDLPFGYLNAAWSQFKGNLVADDLIWAFSAQYNHEWGGGQIREGYVIVRGDIIEPHFLNSLRRLENEEIHAHVSEFEAPEPRTIQELLKKQS